MRSSRSALENIPPLDLRNERGHVGLSVRDIRAIEHATELRFVNAGGRAGGIKAVHRRLGLFLKFAFDQEGIYGSLGMAAKAAKREAAASRWVHGLDRISVSTPLLECVDLPVRTTRGAWRVIRVQVFAKVDVESSSGVRHGQTDGTLRVGSSDGGKTVHFDSEQSRDVVQPLANHFFLAPNKHSSCKKLIKHKYVSRPLVLPNQR